METKRVLIVAEDPLARAGLAALLAGRDGWTVAGQVAADETDPDTGEHSAVAVFRPDVVLWDLGWEGDPALDRLAAFAAEGPPVVALVPDAGLAPAVQNAGARGLLRRDTTPEPLLAALGAVLAGLLVLDPALGGSLATRAAPPAADLTPREVEVLALLAEGLANRAIAQRLAISEHTVKFHLNAILGKLGAQSRTEAVVLAIRLGLITV